MNLRTMTRVGLPLALCAAVGCANTGHHKHKKCDVCEQGTAYYYDNGAGSNAMPAAPGAPYSAPPSPILTPQPLQDSQIPAVPPPPTGSAERPSRFQAMRERTGDFFRGAGNNFRERFSRDDTVVR